MNILDSIALSDFRSTRVEFYADLAEMFDANQNFRSFLERQFSIAQRTGQSSLRKALGIMIDRFDDNSADADLSLVYLLTGVAPDDDLVALSAIDQTPNKGAGLKQLAENVTRQKEILNVLIVYLGGPLLMIPVVAGLAYILSGVILDIEKSSPEYVRDTLFKTGGFNWLVRECALFAKNYGIEFLVVSGSVVGIFCAVLFLLTGPTRVFLDRQPGFSLYRDFEAARMFSNLSMLLGSGAKLIPSLDSLSQMGSRWSRWQYRRVLGYLEFEATQYIEAFCQGMCSAYVEGRIETLMEAVRQREARGDQSASFGDVLIAIGGNETKKTLEKFKKSAKRINMVIVGSLAGFALILGMGTITVPGDFAFAMDPNKIIQLKQEFDAKKAAAQGGK